MNIMKKQNKMDFMKNYIARGYELLVLHGINPTKKCTCGNQNCENAGKHPVGRGWTPSNKYFLTEFSPNPDYNIGIKTGTPSGIFVVDLDVNNKHNGIESWRQLEEKYGEIKTFTVASGGNGQHKYFKLPANLKIPSGTDVLKNFSYPGIDIRAEGGYIVAPPSLHRSGKRYEELSDIDHMADAPGWLLDFFPVPPKASFNQLPILSGFEIHEGSRNNQLASLAGRMRYQGKNEEEILENLLQENNNRCTPPLPENEVASIAKSIGNYPIGEQRIEDQSASEEQHEVLRGTRYGIKDGCLCKISQIKKTLNYDPLCNFVAWIDKVEVLDDGEMPEYKFQIRGKLKTGIDLPPISITAQELNENWALKYWGHKAVIYVGSTIKEHIRVILQLLGKDALKKITYKHTGWRTIEKKKIYLTHGSEFEDAPVTVDLEFNSLKNYNLTSSSTDFEAKEAGLAFLDVATPESIYPLFGLICLSIAREILKANKIQMDALPFLVGKTGSGKSTLAALVLSFFGDFETTSFPASFRDTSNALEKKMFMLKDSLLVIDDFYPGQSKQEKDQLKRLAQSISRLIGDGANRSRMTASMKAQRSFFPRCMVMCTGEQIPTIGQSGQLRFFFIEIKRETLNYDTVYKPLWKKRTALKKWSQLYIAWLNQNWTSLTNEVPVLYDECRSLICPSIAGGRIQNSATLLLLGNRLGLKFMADQGWLTPESFNEYSETATRAIITAAEKNSEESAIHDPVSLFIDLLKELLANNTVTVKSISDILSHDEFGPESNAIGVYNTTTKEYLLFPNRTYGAVQRAMRDQGLEFPIEARALWLQINEAGLLKEADPHRILIQKRIKGDKKRVRVLSIKPEVFEDDIQETDPNIDVDDLF